MDITDIDYMLGLLEEQEFKNMSYMRLSLKNHSK